MLAACVSSLVWASGCGSGPEFCEEGSKECTSAGGNGGSSGSAGKGGTSGGSGNSGGSDGSTSGSGGTAAEAGQAGSGGVPPCDGSCGGDTPVCDTSNDTCVGCLGNDDCDDPTALCDTDAKVCVECLGNEDCTDPAASLCDAGACVGCGASADCEHISEKTVCDTDASECVECTGTDYASCGEDMGTPLVCDSLARTCTTNQEHSAGLCKTCVSDAQCDPGEMCVLQQFSDQDVGYFCFWKKGDTANGAPALCSSGRPYVDTVANAVSVDGTVADICGLRVSTCPAKNEFSSKDCTTSAAADDSKCSFDPTNDSKCAQYDVGVYRCTMTCLSDDDCPNGSACDTGANPAVCQL